MKPNFHAIDSIAFGLRYGFTGLGTALRLGWVSALLVIAGSYYFITTADANGVLPLTYLFDQAAGAMVNQFLSQLSNLFPALSDVEVTINDLEMTDEEAFEMLGAVNVMAGASFIGTILFIPAMVAMTREGAGLEARGGFLPAFGRNEWCYLAAYLILIVLFLLGFLVAFFGMIPGIALSEAADIEPAPVFILTGLLMVVLVIWFSIRITLFPTHAALTGRIALGEAFGLTGGRFWKLLGTLLLFGLVMGLISSGGDILSFGLAGTDPMTFLAGRAAIGLIIQLYTVTAQSAFYGRIAGELMGIFDENGGPTGFDDVDDFEGAGDEDDFAELGDDQPISTMAADRQRQTGAPMMRSAFAADERSHDHESADTRASSGAERNSSVQFIRSRFR